MAYRKITVDGNQYEYTIGKTHVKFRGGKAVPVAEIGEECEKHKDGGIETVYMVTPSLIVTYLKKSAIS